MSNTAQRRHRGFLTPPIIPAFDTFETLVTFAAVIIVNYAIGDGRTHWLEGLILIVIYVLIGLSVWYVLCHLSFTRDFAHRTQVLSWHLVRGITLTGTQPSESRPGLASAIEGANDILCHETNEALNCLLDSYKSVY